MRGKRLMGWRMYDWTNHRILTLEEEDARKEMTDEERKANGIEEWMMSPKMMVLEDTTAAPRRAVQLQMSTRRNASVRTRLANTSRHAHQPGPSSHSATALAPRLSAEMRGRCAHQPGPHLPRLVRLGRVAAQTAPGFGWLLVQFVR